MITIIFFLVGVKYTPLNCVYAIQGVNARDFILTAEFSGMLFDVLRKLSPLSSGADKYTASGELVPQPHGP